MFNHKSIGSMVVGLSIILLVTLVIVKINTDREEAFMCKFVETSPTLTMDQCPAHGSKTSWLLLVIFGISFLVLGAGIYMLFLPVKKEQDHEPIADIDASALPEEEAKVYNMIKLSQGSMYQSDVIKQTELSKVKVSRILDKMEGKGILERKRRGMTNIIILR